ncbi:MAG: hypothetical protein R3B72_05070 [Polyangiaceae bacterium]
MQTPAPCPTARDLGWLTGGLTAALATLLGLAALDRVVSPGEYYRRFLPSVTAVAFVVLAILGVGLVGMLRAPSRERRGLRLAATVAITLGSLGWALEATSVVLLRFVARGPERHVGDWVSLAAILPARLGDLAVVLVLALVAVHQRDDGSLTGATLAGLVSLAHLVLTTLLEIGPLVPGPFLGAEAWAWRLLSLGRIVEVALLAAVAARLWRRASRASASDARPCGAEGPAF